MDLTLRIQSNSVKFDLSFCLQNWYQQCVPVGNKTGVIRGGGEFVAQTPCRALPLNPTWELSLPNPLGYSPQMKILAPMLGDGSMKSVFNLR